MHRKKKKITYRKRKITHRKKAWKSMLFAPAAVSVCMYVCLYVIHMYNCYIRAVSLPYGLKIHENTWWQRRMTTCTIFKYLYLLYYTHTHTHIRMTWIMAVSLWHSRVKQMKQIQKKKWKKIHENTWWKRRMSRMAVPCSMASLSLSVSLTNDICSKIGTNDICSKIGTREHLVETKDVENGGAVLHGLSLSLCLSHQWYM